MRYYLSNFYVKNLNVFKNSIALSEALKLYILHAIVCVGNAPNKRKQQQKQDTTTNNNIRISLGREHLA